MKWNKSILLLASLSWLSLAFAADNPRYLNIDTSRTGMDSTAFDFWLGKWNATWTSSGKTFHATNHITRKMNNHFIHESFEIIDGPMKGYKGESYSTLDKPSGQWKQTWIDNQGSYLDFTGKQEGDNRIFERSFTNKAGEAVRQRMVFRNIKPDTFDWDWQSSKNGGEWQMMWQLQYTRSK